MKNSDQLIHTYQNENDVNKRMSIALAIFDAHKGFMFFTLHKQQRCNKDNIQDCFFGILQALKYYKIGKGLPFIKFFEWGMMHSWRYSTVSLLKDKRLSELLIKYPNEENDYQEHNLDYEKLVTKSNLSEREKYIVNRRLDGFTLQDISENFNLSRERIRQILEKAFSKMKAVYDKDEEWQQELKNIFSPKFNNKRKQLIINRKRK